MAAGKVTESHEDYLEAIVMLGGTDKVPVRPVDVANKLGVSKASVNKAVSVLKEAGMLEQPYYGDITLTKKGYKYGCEVFARHKTLTRFLIAIGVDEDVADAEACMIEHDISEETFKKWASYIEKKKM
ncbi:MAG: metal-dependent transcriptional regulator [Eggerthellaceae bacterium]|nr:metal-dependent transcriptional regulator [Eggerthellaceae bacterium]